MKSLSLNSSVDWLAENILDIILEHSLTPQSTRTYQLEKILGYLRMGEPIQIVLPAFPAKSPNPRKTLGHLPDYGEVLALGRLNEMCAQIGRAYPAGARLIICSDGRVFGDLVEVPDTLINEYGTEIHNILGEYKLRYLSTFNLEDIFVDCQSYDEMRDRLVSEFARPVEEVREQVISDPEYRQLFNGIHRFLFEDQLVIHPERSKNQTRNLSKAMAYEVIQRSNAWSELVETKFPNAIRLSIHPQSMQSRKIGFRLLPSNDLWRTPWHSVVLFDGKKYLLVQRHEAEAMQAVATRVNDKYAFFTAPGAQPCA